MFTLIKNHQKVDYSKTAAYIDGLFVSFQAMPSPNIFDYHLLP